MITPIRASFTHLAVAPPCNHFLPIISRQFHSVGILLNLTYGWSRRSLDTTTRYQVSLNNAINNKNGGSIEVSNTALYPRRVLHHFRLIEDRAPPQALQQVRAGSAGTFARNPYGSNGCALSTGCAQFTLLRSLSILMNSLFQIHLRSPQGIILRTCDTPPRLPTP